MILFCPVFSLSVYLEGLKLVEKRLKIIILMTYDLIVIKISMISIRMVQEDIFWPNIEVIH